MDVAVCVCFLSVFQLLAAMMMSKLKLLVPVIFELTVKVSVTCICALGLIVWPS
jgi:hypothetical protein